MASLLHIFPPFPFPTSPPHFPLAPAYNFPVCPCNAGAPTQDAASPLCCRNLPFSSQTCQFSHSCSLGIQGRFRSAFVLPRFCIFSKPFFCICDPIGPRVCVSVCVCGCDMKSKQRQRAFGRCFVWSQWTERRMDLVELSLGRKLLCGALSFQLIFPDQLSARSALKDATRRLRLSPRAFTVFHH